MRTMQEYRQMVDESLPNLLVSTPDYGGLVLEAARYSLLLNGKRVRSALLLAACEAVGGDPKEALTAACAIECIHTYSLIHDDLPALDDDTLRRGLPACHVKFGEDIAILAGDGLNTHAFWLLAESASKAGSNMERHVRALSCIASAAGMFGMVAGQAADVRYSDDADQSALSFIHQNKTAGLFAAALLTGAEIGGASALQCRLFSEYGMCLGLAYQAADDVLDATSTPEELGKTPGKDERAHKLTTVTLFGLEAARKLVREKSRRAAEVIRPLGQNAAFFIDTAEDLCTRKK